MSLCEWMSSRKWILNSNFNLGKLATLENTKGQSFLLLYSYFIAGLFRSLTIVSFIGKINVRERKQ